MPIIKSQQAIALLKPELPVIKRLIEERDRQTGRVPLPEGLRTALYAEQRGGSGCKGQRGPAIEFDEKDVNTLLRELQQLRAQQRAQRQAQQRPAQMESDPLLAMARSLGPRHSAVRRALERQVRMS